MVFIITGAAESFRNTVARLLAESLGWEFVDAASLSLPGCLDRRRFSDTLTDPTLRIESLSAAICLWTYEWRDVVVSCSPLTETDRRQLSKMSSLVKIVCLEASRATGRTRLVDRSARIGSSALPAAFHVSHHLRQDVLTVDSSRNVEEIIADMTAALIM